MTMSSTLQSLPFEQQSALLTKLQAIQTERRLTRRLSDYKPYPKQLEFHANGAVHRERLLMAGNQVGKTICGASELAMHLTGRYPDWWPGKRWDRPTRWWAGSRTSEVTRDGPQRYLIGEPKDESTWGTAAIPKETLVRTARRQGIPDALDSALVKHVTGGHSTLGFRSYDQGRAKWQAETLDGVWFDEEPPIDVYFEGLTRTNATGGIVYLTFTPWEGMTEVVRSFLQDLDIEEVMEEAA